jgi:hypothetical protein
MTLQYLPVMGTYNCLFEMIDIAQSSVLNWFSANKLVCNPNKTQSITFSLTQNIVPQSVKMLGILLDSKMNWKEQIEGVCKKISRVNYLFWKLKSYITDEYLRIAYFGLFQSHCGLVSQLGVQGSNPASYQQIFAVAQKSV